eukprot:SAG11_NODE_173_length_13507_cov_10.489931_11_plen_226_part_00
MAACAPACLLSPCPSTPRESDQPRASTETRIRNLAVLTLFEVSSTSHPQAWYSGSDRPKFHARARTAHMHQMRAIPQLQHGTTEPPSGTRGSSPRPATGLAEVENSSYPMTLWTFPPLVVEEDQSSRYIYGFSFLFFSFSFFTFFFLPFWVCGCAATLRPLLVFRLGNRFQRHNTLLNDAAELTFKTYNNGLQRSCSIIDVGCANFGRRLRDRIITDPRRHVCRL